MQSTSTERDVPTTADSRVPLAAAISVAIAVAFFVALPPGSRPASDSVRFLGRFHTLALHLPIGILLLVALGEVTTLFGRFSDRRRAAIDAALGGVLAFLLLGMVVTFAAGALLASGGGYPPRLVGLHRSLGLAGVIGIAACFVAWARRGNNRTAYRVVLLATVGLVTIGAHFGGSITHGDSYLVRFAPAWLHAPPPPPPPAPVPAATAQAQPVVFQDVILPVLVKRCAECHGDKKESSSLRLDSFAALQKGSEDGPVLIAGNSAKSSLITRMTFPPEDDQHMPPSPKEGPSADEIALMKWWIDRGAPEKLLVSDVLPPASVRTVLEKK